MENKEDIILSVTEISLSLKGCVEQIFGHVKVRGEISGLKRAASGHTYFSLKDADSVLSAVCWRGRSETTQAALQEGLEVVCTGKLSTYPGRSNYQMIVETVEPSGEGALLKLLKERKEKLEKEGLFDVSRKKKIPYLPEVIGVVTSPSGAVIRDIMHRLQDRFPRPILLWPVLVQGVGASEQIAHAIQGFNQIPKEGIVTPNGVVYRPDVLIVARGGGSLEDLWCFNEEIVVRAVAASDIPIISAVGHETDTTLIDYVADLRAPTPTGAAEKAVPVRSELQIQLQGFQNRLMDASYRLCEEQKIRLTGLSRSLPNLSEVVDRFIQKLDDRSERLEQSFQVFICLIQNKLETLSKLLKSYSYHSILERGFALISGTSGKIIGKSQDAQAEKRLKIMFADGSLSVIPEKKESRLKKVSSRLSEESKKKKEDLSIDSQPNLFD